MTKKRLWLPPIDLCCSKASFGFQLFMTLEMHLKMECPMHGKHFVKSPLRASRHEVEVYPSKNLFILIWKRLTEKQKALVNRKVLEKYDKIINKLGRR